MPIIEVDASTKEPRIYQGRKKWGVKPKGEDGWLNMFCDFRPMKNMRFQVSIKETQGKDGRVFRDAEIIGPAGLAPDTPPPAPPAQTPSVEAQFNQIKPNSYAEAPRNNKIPWSDWSLMCRAAHELACLLEPDDQGEHICERSNARAALVNTVMIAFSNGKLETPVEAGPVSDGDAEVKEDDIPW